MSGDVWFDTSVRVPAGVSVFPPQRECDPTPFDTWKVWCCGGVWPRYWSCRSWSGGGGGELRLKSLRIFFFLLPAGWDRLSSFVLHLSLTRETKMLRFSLSQLWPQTSAIRLLDYQVIAKIQRRGDNNRVWWQSGCKSAVSSTDSGQEQTQRAQGVCAKNWIPDHRTWAEPSEWDMVFH